jgi:hypothetical protein
LERDTSGKINDSKNGNISEKCKLLHNDELHVVDRSHSIVRLVKSGKLLWACQVAKMRQTRNSYRILVRRPFGKCPLGRPKRRL